MRNFSSGLFIALAALVLGASCAEKTTTDTEALETKSFEAWVKKHLIDKGVEVAKQDNGMYIEFLNDVNDPGLLSTADTAVWVRLEYTATNLENDVFVTRSAAQALKQKTYTLFTYYTPDYIFCGSENYNMVKGQYFAIKEKELKKPDGTTTRLRKGSEIRMYMPSFLAFGSAGYSDDQGYGGQYALTGSVPVIETIKIVEITKDPIEREVNLVKERAEGSASDGGWGLVVDGTRADTVVTNLYLDTLFYENAGYQNYKDMVKEFKEEYALTVDSTAKIWFVGKFLDGFIFDTNIDSVYTRFHSRTPGYTAPSETHSVLSYKPGDNKPEDNKGNYIQAFYHAALAMRKGQWGRIVFPSVYGYGATGLSAAIKKQQEYYSYYMNYMSSYYNSGYGYGGGYGGYGGYYDPYYSPYYNDYNYLNSSISASTEEQEASIVTEIQPYTPLIFEIYIESGEDD